MRISPCTPQCVEQVGNFYDQTVLYLTQTTNWPKWRYKFYPTTSSVEQNTKEGSQYVCWQGDKVVGAFVLNNDPQGDYSVGDWSKQLDDSQFLVIHSFATHPSMYKQGIATKMLNFCLELAQKQGKQAIRLDVVPTNLPARAFYEKHGFVFVGEKDLKRDFDDIPTFCLYEYNF